MTVRFPAPLPDEALFRRLYAWVHPGCYLFCPAVESLPVGTWEEQFTPLLGPATSHLQHQPGRYVPILAGPPSPEDESVPVRPIILVYPFGNQPITVADMEGADPLHVLRQGLGTYNVGPLATGSVGLLYDYRGGVMLSRSEHGSPLRHYPLEKRDTITNLRRALTLLTGEEVARIYLPARANSVLAAQARGREITFIHG